MNMLYPDNEFANDENIEETPNAYRVDDENEETEDSLRRNDNQGNPVAEGQPMGGHSFGENNTIHAGDDKNNPSLNAGYRNEYFRRTEPSEEHPENNNFKPDEDNQTQEGTTDKNGPQD